VVNASARTMRSGRTGVIGVVVTQVTSPFHVHLLDALSGAIHAANYRMILWDGMRDGEIAAVTALREKAVDSVIFTTASTASDALRDAVGRELPVVLVDRLLPGLRCDGVTSDNLASARNVARYFLEAGRTAIAMIGGPPGSSTADERQQGFKSGLTSPAKRKPTLIATADDWVYEEGARAFHEILDHGRVPDAIFCASDVLACGAMDAARAQGLRIPEDLWIAGYDDISVSAWDSYDLTTVRQPLGRMAEQAVRLAVDRLDNPERAPKRSRLASQLVIRGSTARHGSAVASAVSLRQCAGQPCADAWPGRHRDELHAVSGRRSHHRRDRLPADRANLVIERPSPPDQVFRGRRDIGAPVPEVMRFDEVAAGSHRTSAELCQLDMHRAVDGVGHARLHPGDVAARQEDVERPVLHRRPQPVARRGEAGLRGFDVIDREAQVEEVAGIERKIRLSHPARSSRRRRSAA